MTTPCPPLPDDAEAFEALAATGRQGQPIDLPISTGPATGYAWQLELPAGVVRVADGPGRAVGAAVAIGSAAGGCIRVQAPAGLHCIQARLCRPWQLDDVLRRVRILVQVT